MFRDHKLGPPVHLRTNNNTLIQTNGAKMAAESAAVERPGLLRGPWPGQISF